MAKKRYAKATVAGVEHVFEFDVKDLDNKRLIAAALGVRESEVRNVSPNSASTGRPSWYAKATSAKHQYAVSYVVRA